MIVLVWRLTLLLMLTCVAIAGVQLVRWHYAEWQIAAATVTVSSVLRGELKGVEAQQAAAAATSSAQKALALVPGDERAALIAGTAMTITGNGAKALELLEPVVAAGGRPELLVALGRARAATGDDVGARRAFLRAAWASPASVRTLPRTVRAELQARVESIEQDLNAGRLQAAPPQ